MKPNLTFASPLHLLRTASAFVLLGILCASPAAGAETALTHYRPLATENLTTLPAGRYQLELGADFRKDESFPFSGLRGDFLRLADLSFSVGLGSNATFFVRGAPYQRLAVDRRTPGPNAAKLTFAGSTTDAVGNFSLGTKLRFSRTKQDQVGFGFQFALELPNTPNETGLGNDETNFFGTFIGEFRSGDTELFANLGLGILGDPSTPNNQKDKILYGLGFQTPLSESWNLLGEANGRSGSSNPGTEDRSVARLALQQSTGDWRWDAGVMAGLKDVDADWGVTAGVTRLFGK